MNTKRIGDVGEEIAANFLTQCGYKILERNVEYCGVEIDIVAKIGTTTVFCEVKTRCNTAYGRPVEAVTASKRNRYRTAANAYIVSNRMKNPDVRFDVIEVLDGEITHLEGAF